MTKALRKLDRTPVLAGRLAAVRRRMVRAILVHASGTVALVLCAWIAFAFFADRVLEVPQAVRWFHLFLLLALPVAVAWREGWRHLRQVPDEAGLAVLAERAAPQSEDLFVSAVQLQARVDAESGLPLEDQLIGRVLSRAEELAGRVDTGQVLDLRGPNRRALIGASAAAVTILWLALLPAGHAAIFGTRLLGGDTPWPQRTFLELELPVTGDSASVEIDGETLRARVARGSDLPVLVLARGVTPDEVRLVLDDGREIELGGGRDGLFRTQLPALRDSLSFSVTGGDDVDGLPRAEIEVLQPPDITAVAIRVTPPAYSGLPVETFYDRGGRALQGSRVEVVCTTTPRLVEATVEVLPAGSTETLLPRPFPTADGEPQVEGVGFEFVADKDVRLRFRLRDENGLGNPDPGLFAVDVVEDRVPEVAVIAPGRTNVESVAGGALALRARLQDDFGLTGASLRVSSADAEESALVESLTLTGLEFASDDRTTAARVHRLLEIDELLAGLTAQGAQGVDQLVLELSTTDSATPPQRGAAAPIRVRILSFDELLRRVQDRLAQARVEAGELAELQRERRIRTQDLVTSLEGDGALDATDTRAVQSSLNGQRRVTADAESLLRELASAAEIVLYARLDPKGDALLEVLDTELSSRVERTFDPQPWRSVVDNADLGGDDEGFASHLVGIIDLSLRVLDMAEEGTAALTRSESAVDGATMRTELERAVEAQGQTLQRIEDLLDRLAEWDNFQSVLALTRDILERQRAIRDRVERLASEK
ncbi:MAG: hypothetical protein ACYSWX_07805 [Planctomycetota bacterium]